jgi:hypothetical protein
MNAVQCLNLRGVGECLPDLPMALFRVARQLAR